MTHSKYLSKFQDKLPWTFRFVADWAPHLTVRSLLGFRDFVVRKEKGLAADRILTLKLRAPISSPVRLREIGSDVHTFDEVIKQQIYKGVLSHIDDCRTIIDLGANIGLASLYFTAHYPSCRVVVVEPNRSSFALLSENLAKLTAQDRCQLMNVAVWGKDGVLTGAVGKESTHYSAFAIQEVHEELDHEETIQGVTLSQIIANAGLERVDILKVDIEGAEVELFRGDLNWLRQVRLIAIEFHGDSRTETRFDEIMEEYRFRIHDHNSHTVIAMSTT